MYHDGGSEHFFESGNLEGHLYLICGDERLQILSLDLSNLWALCL